MCVMQFENVTAVNVARFLKLMLLYIHFDESAWHPKKEPKRFKTRSVKRLTQAEKFIFQIM